MTGERDGVLKLLEKACEAFSAGDPDGYAHCMSEAGARIDMLPRPESDAMRGEWELMARLDTVFDIDASLTHLRRAHALLNGRRSAIGTHLPLNLGADGILGMVLLRGDLDRTLDGMRELAQLYNDLTGGGLGYDLLLETEIAYYRCQLDAAAVLAHQVVYAARNTGQAQLAVAGAKYLAQIAKHRGDADGWTYAIHVINTVMKETVDDKRMQNGINLVRYELSTLLGNFTALPAWMRDGVLPLERSTGVLGLGCRMRDDTRTVFGLPYMMWTHALYLVLTGQYDRALAVDALQHALHIDTLVPMLDLYFKQLRAICLLKRGDRPAAKALLREVVGLALSERMPMLVAELAPFLDGMTEELVRERDAAACATMLEITRKMPVNPKKIRESVSGVHAVANLTAREREVAELAANGLSNQQIAEKLCVTQQTVKFHLGNVYQKLSVSGRNRMAAILRSE